MNFLCAVPRYDVIEGTRFLMRPPVIHSTMVLKVSELNNSVKERARQESLHGKCVWIGGEVDRVGRGEGVGKVQRYGNGVYQ